MRGRFLKALEYVKEMGLKDLAAFLKLEFPSGKMEIFSCVLHPTLSIGRLVGQSVGRLSHSILLFCGLGPHCSCPNILRTSSKPSAHWVRLAFFLVFCIFPFFFSAEQLAKKKAKETVEDSHLGNYAIWQ